MVELKLFSKNNQITKFVINLPKFYFKHHLKISASVYQIFSSFLKIHIHYYIKQNQHAFDSCHVPYYNNAQNN